MYFTQSKIAEGTSAEYLQSSLNFTKIQKKKNAVFYMHILRNYV